MVSGQRGEQVLALCELPLHTFFCSHKCYFDIVTFEGKDTSRNIQPLDVKVTRVIEGGAVGGGEERGSGRASGHY